MKIRNILAVLLIVPALAACKKEQQGNKKMLSAGDVVPVKTAAVTAQQLQEDINATGLLTTENDAKYGFKIGGVIEKIYVSEGQYFKKGQLLATLFTTEINAQLQQAQLAQDKAKRDHQRAENLYKDSVATLEQVQNAKTGLDVAQKTIDLINFNRQYTAIYATADGFVTRKLASEGEVIAPGSPVLVINETAGQNSWVLKVGVTDEEWARLAINQKASISLDAFPGKNFSGYIYKKSQAADPMSGSFQVDIRVDLGGLQPAVGMFGKALITGNTSRQIHAIPYDALIEADGNKAFVFVPVGSDKVKKVPVSIASFDNNKVYVWQGLEQVSQVIVANSAFLNENTRINIIQ